MDHTGTDQNYPVLSVASGCEIHSCCQCGKGCLDCMNDWFLDETKSRNENAVIMCISQATLSWKIPDENSRQSMLFNN